MQQVSSFSEWFCKSMIRDWDVSSLAMIPEDKVTISYPDSDNSDVTTFWIAVCLLPIWAYISASNSSYLPRIKIVSHSAHLSWSESFLILSCCHCLISTSSHAFLFNKETFKIFSHTLGSWKEVWRRIQRERLRWLVFQGLMYEFLRRALCLQQGR